MKYRLKFEVEVEIEAKTKQEAVHRTIWEELLLEADCRLVSVEEARS